MRSGLLRPPAWNLALCGALAVVGCEWVAGELPQPVEPGAASPGTGGTGGLENDAGEEGNAGSVGPDAETSLDATSDTGLPADASCVEACDCDGDDERAKGACGGNDCDDGDSRAHPGQSAYFTTPAPTAGFDFDCNGSVDRDPEIAREHPCEGISLAFCDDVGQGYLDGLPSCGSSGSWGTCHKGVLACEADVLESKPMACH